MAPLRKTNKLLASVFSSSNPYPALHATYTEHKYELKRQLQLKQVLTIVSSVFGGMAIFRRFGKHYGNQFYSLRR